MLTGTKNYLKSCFNSCKHVFKMKLGKNKKIILRYIQNTCCGVLWVALLLMNLIKMHVTGPIT